MPKLTIAGETLSIGGVELTLGTFWDHLQARYCPTLDSTGNGTSTIYNLDSTGSQVGSADGTLTNMVPASDWVSATGHGGIRAIDFDGSDDRIDATKSFTGLTGVTLAYWFKRSAPSTYGPMFGIGVSGGNTTRVIIQPWNDGEVYITIGGYFTSFTMNDTDWHHVAVTWEESITDPGVDPGTVRMYLDGAEVVVDTNAPAVIGNQTLIRIGANINTSPTPVGSGLMDDAMVFSSVLDVADIEIIAGTPGIVESTDTFEGVVNYTLSNLTYDITGTITTPLADVTYTLSDIVYSTTGSSEINGVVDYTLNEIEYDTTGVLTPQFGIVDFTLDEIEYDVTSEVFNQGTVDYTLSDILFNVESSLALFGEVDYQLNSIIADVQGVFGNVAFGVVDFTLSEITYNTTGIVVPTIAIYGEVDAILDEIIYDATISLKNRKKRNLFIASGSLFSKDRIFICSN